MMEKRDSNVEKAVFRADKGNKRLIFCPFAEKVVLLRPYRVRRGPRSRVAPCVPRRFERKGADEGAKRAPRKNRFIQINHTSHVRNRRDQRSSV